MNTKGCPKCKTMLDFSRKDLKNLKFLIERKKGNRYFLPDEETAEIIHNFHIKKYENQNP